TMWNHGPQMAERMEREKVTRPTFTGSELADLIAYINAASAKSTLSPLYVLPGRTDVGGRLFVEKRCVECHPLGRADDAVAPNLTERALHRSLTEFAAAMWNKAPKMMEAMKARAVRVPQLKPEEMVDIVAFLYSARYFKQAGDPRNGVIVATNKGCLSCHGLYGERGKVAGDLNAAPGVDTAAGALSALWNHSFIAEPKLERETTPWPTFRGEEMADLGRLPRPRSFYDLAAALWNHAPRMADRMRELGIARPQLDARETGDLVAFLFTLDYFDPRGTPEVGRRLFTEKRCIVCHQVGGVGGVVGPSLDFLRQYGSPIYLATAMWNHGPQMADAMRAKRIPRPTFKDSDLRDLIAYIDAASPVLPQGPLYVLPGRATQGRVLFAQKRCIECHSAGSKGATLGPDLAERGLHLSLSQFAATMWNKAPRMMEAM